MQEEEGQKMKGKLRSRNSRMSIASGLSTPFDVDDMEELMSANEDEQRDENDEVEQPGTSSVPLTNYDDVVDSGKRIILLPNQTSYE